MQMLTGISWGFQALAAIGGWNKVATKDNYVVSRRWNSASLGAVTSDYFVKYSQHHTNAELAAIFNFATITIRSLLILGLNLDDKNPRHVRLQKRISLAAFFIGTTLAIGSQLINKHSIDPKTLFPLTSLALGCAADATNSMFIKRRLFFVMGSCTLPFALMTNAYGLAGKNLTDIGSSLYYAIKHKDPLPSVRPALQRVKSSLAKLQR